MPHVPATADAAPRGDDSAVLTADLVATLAATGEDLAALRVAEAILRREGVGAAAEVGGVAAALAELMVHGGDVGLAPALDRVDGALRPLLGVVGSPAAQVATLVAAIAAGLRRDFV
jgi:hypothetical protein